MWELFRSDDYVTVVAILFNESSQNEIFKNVFHESVFRAEA